MVFPRIFLCSLLQSPQSAIGRHLAIYYLSPVKMRHHVIMLWTMSAGWRAAKHRVLYRFIAGNILPFITMSKKEYSVRVE